MDAWRHCSMATRFHCHWVNDRFYRFFIWGKFFAIFEVTKSSCGFKLIFIPTSTSFRPSPSTNHQFFEKHSHKKSSLQGAAKRNRARKNFVVSCLNLHDFSSLYLSFFAEFPSIIAFWRFRGFFLCAAFSQWNPSCLFLITMDQEVMFE